MPMSNYRAGYELERAVKMHLESEGYWVIASRSSKGAIDLLAMKPGQALFIQAKKNGRISPAERTEVIRIAGLVQGGVPIVAWKQDGVVVPQFSRLTGPGPHDRVPFLTAEVAA